MNLKIQSTAYPNGDYTTYTNGMPVPKILPSNHPDVLLMRYKRAVNTFKPKRSNIAIAKAIIKYTSEKLSR